MCSLLLSAQPSAEQLQFQRQGANYAYLWQDSQGERHQLSFQLHSYPLRLTRFTQYRQSNANDFVVQHMYQEIAKVDPKREAQIELHEQDGQLSFQIIAKDQEKLAELRKKLSEGQASWFRTFLDEHFFTEFTLYDQRRVVMPDHNRMAKESHSYLKDWLDQSIASFGDKEPSPRELLDYLLSFTQSIPYNTLQSVDNNRGAGFFTPIQVLRNNQGDCDSKATLLASALKYRYPRLDIAIVYVPEHALLAVNLPPQPTDRTTEFKGITYVLLEPTGPAQMPVGEVGAESWHAIQSGMFSFQRMDWVPEEFTKQM